MEPKTIVFIVSTIIALSGWSTLFYNWYTTNPKIEGQVLTFLDGELQPSPSEPKIEMFLVYLYLTNVRKNPVHILDYELEIDFGTGYERAKRVYGTNNIIESNFNTPDIAIPNLKNKFIYSRKEPIEYGVPFHGFAMFAMERQPSPTTNRRKLKRLRVTCIDAFQNRHIIKTSPDKFPSMYLVQELTGITIKQKAVP